MSMQSDPYEEYLALMQSAYGGWDPNEPYHWSNDIPEQLYDLYKPRSDSQANTMVNRAFPMWDEFSNDVVLQADPLVQGYLVEALANNKGDTIAAMNEINSKEFDLKGRVGRTAWDDIKGNADTATRRAMMRAKTGEEKDKVAVNYITRALENLFAQGAPSMSRNAGIQDQLLQRFGARPIPGGELPLPGGPGVGGYSADITGGRPADVDPDEFADAQRLVPSSAAAEAAASRNPFVSDRNLMFTALAERYRQGGKPTERKKPSKPGFGPTRALAAEVKRRASRNGGNNSNNDGGGGWLSKKPWIIG